MLLGRCDDRSSGRAREGTHREDPTDTYMYTDERPERWLVSIQLGCLDRNEHGRFFVVEVTYREDPTDTYMYIDERPERWLFSIQLGCLDRNEHGRFFVC